MRNYPKDSPFWSLMTFVAIGVLGAWLFIGGRWVWRKVTTDQPTPDAPDAPKP